MKPTIFTKEAILFDLDGVLVDSKIPVEKSRDWDAAKNPCPRCRRCERTLKLRDQL